ncbi:MAG: prephenate dehydratase [Pirellula sp.]
MTEKKQSSHESIDPNLAKQLDEIDTRILGAVMERCELLMQRKGAAEGGSDFPSLRDFQASVAAFAASHRNARLAPEAQVGVDDFAERLIGFVSGLTYQTAVQRQTIAYLGPAYSYSYSAAAKYFGAITELLPVNSITAVFEEIERGQSRYGVVPIENSTDGRIVDTLNMFIKSPIRICGEVLLPIHHNLIAKCRREEIREVYSKPQALSQCRQWLNNHLPEARWVEVASTAAAAKIAATTPNAAAVASREAAIFEGLDLVAESIEDNPNNVTRFAILGNETVQPTGDDKTSLMFQVPHQPGALADVMVLFRDHGINLTWIESFPVPGRVNEYFFFVELEGHQSQVNLKQTISTLASTALRLSFLGSYPKARS